MFIEVDPETYFLFDETVPDKSRSNNIYLIRYSGVIDVEFRAKGSEQVGGNRTLLAPTRF